MRKLRVRLISVAALVVTGLGATGCGAMRAGRMLQDALGPVDALAPEVAERSDYVMSGGRVIPVRVYRPVAEADALPGILLVHGAVDGGAADARLVALARAVAVRGSTVVTPQLESLARFRLDARDPEHLGSVIAWMLRRTDIVDGERVGCVGISVGGSYALIAATRPESAERVGMVLTFGAYADLGVLLRAWMEHPRSDVPGLFDARMTGRRMVLLGNVDALVPERDRAVVSDAIGALLDGRDVPPTPDISDRARTVVDVAASGAPVAPDVVTRLLDPLQDTMAALSPVAMPGRPAAAVYLLHGASDPVVPVSDLEHLRELLTDRGANVDTHVTDLFGHVESSGDVGFFESLLLLQFVAAAMSDAGL